MASVSGHVGQIEHVVYGATKGAILSLYQGISPGSGAMEYSGESISPGSVDTLMLRSDISLEANRTQKTFAEVKKIREAEQALTAGLTLWKLLKLYIFCRATLHRLLLEVIY